MLSKLIFEQALPEAQPAVITTAKATTWSQLRQQAQQVLQQSSALAQRRVGLLFQPTAETYATLMACERLRCDVFLLDSAADLEHALHLSEKLKLGALVVARSADGGIELYKHELPNEGPWSGNSTLTILTSGSTGEPKAARHSWENISRPVRVGTENQAPVWLLTYRPNSYAGLQVMLQCFADRGTLAVPDSHMDPPSTAEFMLKAGVQFVSATPSYWRRLMMFANPEVLRKLPLRQITLGGEVADQAVLDRLRSLYPAARLVHIYATTEMGRCFAVNDGRAGFPVSYLETTHPDRAELRLEDGELMVRSPNAMRMYDPLSASTMGTTDWFPTGDLVEVRDERVYFTGRKTDMINVAGSKVYPLEVERILRTIPGVSDVRVFGKSSSIAGELVACEVVAEADQDPAGLRELITKTCRAQLLTPQQPRLIKFVDQIGLSLAGKTLRSAGGA